MISLLIVNYRSAELAIEAIRTARAATKAGLEVVVVDNSSEAETLRPHATTLIVSETNRGYAGAINDGRPACHGDVIIVSNPDVKFDTGSIDALASALTGDVVVAGPALFWDDAFTWHLPPAELHTAWEILAARDRSRIKQRIAFWSSTATRNVAAVSGAVMAIRSSAFDDLGGFDERFALYFEETDFLRRVAERRKRIAYVPAARCRHLYNQSAAQSDQAAALYARSEMRYLEKWNGPFMARLLKRFEKGVKAGGSQGSQGLDSLDPLTPLLIEASPLASFATAAGHFTSSPAMDVPPEIWNTYRGSALYLRLIERNTARVVATEVRYKS